MTKTTNTKSIIQFIILLSVGILLTWLSIKSVWADKDKIADSFKSANYFWVFVSVIISLLSHYLRAFRWNYLLQPLGYKVKPLNSLGAVLVGYFANYGIPRMGELTRCTIVAKYDKVPFEVALGTVITERIIDVLLLFVIFILTLFAQFSELASLTSEYITTPLKNKLTTLSDQPVKLIIISIIVIGGVIAFLLLRKKISAMLNTKFGSIIKGFGKGLSSVKDMENKYTFILLSVAIWACYFYSLYFCFYAFKETEVLGHSECLALMLFGTFGVAFSPGGLGAYPAIVKNLLQFYGISVITAFAFPWMAWTSQFVLIVSLGLISLIVLPLVNKEKEDVV